MRYTGSHAPGSQRRKLKKNARICLPGSSKLRSRRDDQGRAERAEKRARMKAHLDRQVGVLPDDDDGHLIFKKNDVLHGRWELREELGEGTFGRVIKAYDKQRDKMRAVKIVRNVHKYRDAAYLEIKVLTKLKQLDPNGTHPSPLLRRPADEFHSIL
ncbi:hypothetical protein V3C99_018562 [Haemonchus contortus]